MKGLMAKDFCILLQRKKSFIIILICGLCMSISNDASFFVAYLTMIGTIFTLSTIAYDEFDNSYPFLMTLPVSRKDYAVEKYLFALLISISLWSFSAIIYFLISYFREINLVFIEEISGLLLVLLLPLIVVDFCIPINLKYGSQNSRILIFVLWGIFFAIGMLVKYFIPDIQLPVINISPLIISLIIFVLAIIITLISAMFSISIMNKKEF